MCKYFLKFFFETANFLLIVFIFFATNIKNDPPKRAVFVAKVFAVTALTYKGIFLY